MQRTLIVTVLFCTNEKSKLHTAKLVKCQCSNPASCVAAFCSTCCLIIQSIPLKFHNQVIAYQREMSIKNIARYVSPQADLTVARFGNVKGAYTDFLLVKLVNLCLKTPGFVGYTQKTIVGPRGAESPAHFPCSSLYKKAAYMDSAP